MCLPAGEGRRYSFTFSNRVRLHVELHGRLSQCMGTSTLGCCLVPKDQPNSLSVYWLYANLTQTRVSGDEGASVEKTPPFDWAAGKSVEDFLN